MAEQPMIDGLVAKLQAETSDPSAWSIVDGRVYVDYLPLEPLVPAIRLAVLDDRPDQRLASGDDATTTIQVDIYADFSGGSDAWSIDALIRSALDRKTVAATGFNDVQIMCVKRGQAYSEVPFYRVKSTYKLYGSAS